MYSKENYRAILKLALDEGYQFIGFDDQADPSQRCIYLRHDVDYSLMMALELAEINHSLGIQGTFFLLLRSQVYNLLSLWTLEQVRAIHALGQRIAFHFASSATHNADELASAVRSDFRVASQNLPIMEPVFSWHNPDPVFFDSISNLEVEGLTNTYGARFIKETPYYSDSNMRYTVKQFRNIIGEKHQKLHLLFHPLNWIAGGQDMSVILAATWRYIIRERDQEISQNRHYKMLFPDGIPEEILDRFEQEWLLLSEQGGSK